MPAVATKPVPVLPTRSPEREALRLAIVAHAAAVERVRDVERDIEALDNARYAKVAEQDRVAEQISRAKVDMPLRVAGLLAHAKALEHEIADLRQQGQANTDELSLAKQRTAMTRSAVDEAVGCVVASDSSAQKAVRDFLELKQKVAALMPAASRLAACMPDHMINVRVQANVEWPHSSAPAAVVKNWITALALDADAQAPQV